MDSLSVHDCTKNESAPDSVKSHGTLSEQASPENCSQPPYFLICVVGMAPTCSFTSVAPAPACAGSSPNMSLVMGPAVPDNSTRMTNALWISMGLCKYKTADRRSCNSWVEASDYCPAHRKLMDDVDALDKEVCRIVRDNVIWAQDKLKRGI